MSVDILGTSWDQCRSIVQYSFTFTETGRLIRTDSPGRPPRLSHNSWTMWCGEVSNILKWRVFYTLKTRHRWPRIWNKRRIFNRIGKAVLPCPCMNREACCLQLGQLTGANWNRSFGQWLHTGKETTAPHDRTKTQHRRTIDRLRKTLLA